MRDFLQNAGLLGAVFCPPATPRKHCLVRLSLRSKLTEADLEMLIERCSAAMSAMRERLGQNRQKP